MRTGLIKIDLKEAADQLHVGEDDTLRYVVDGDGLHLTPFDPDFDAAM